MDPRAYSDNFQEQHVAGSLASAAIVLPVLFQFHRPASIVDLGCGLGAWLRAATDLGVGDVSGIDGDYFDREKLLIAPERFRAANLAERIVCERRFDLAITTEVAEHLPFTRSESFVADLVALSDVVLFSAAQPYQGGTDHINEQWLEFWGILFRRHGYTAYDVVRPRVWGDPQVEFWYKQNLLIFAKTELGARIFPSETMAAARGLSLTHPVSLLVNGTRFRPMMLEALQAEAADYQALLTAYVAGETSLPPMQTIDGRGSDQTPIFPDARIRFADAGAAIAHLWQVTIDRDREIARMRAEMDACEREIAELTRARELREEEVAREREAREEEVARERGERDRLSRLATRVHMALAARNRELMDARESPAWKVAARLQALSTALSAKQRHARDVQLVRASGLFDRDYYASQVPELETLGIDPVEHYVLRGAAEGFDPHPSFDSSFYLESNPDVRQSGMNPLAHYHAFGGGEGREPNPNFSTREYLRRHPGAAGSGFNPLLHCLLFENGDGAA